MKDILELTRLYLNETPDSDDMELLNEFIGLRTGAIVVGLVFPSLLHHPPPLRKEVVDNGCLLHKTQQEGCE